MGQLLALVTALNESRLGLVREYDSRRGWSPDGARSMTDWLVARFSISRRPAAELVRVAGATAGLPELSAAASRGEMSFDQLAAASRFADRKSDASWADRVPSYSVAQLEPIARRSRAATAEEANRAHGEAVPAAQMEPRAFKDEAVRDLARPPRRRRPTRSRHGDLRALRVELADALVGEGQPRRPHRPPPERRGAAQPASAAQAGAPPAGQTTSDSPPSMLIAAPVT
jgi:hypothetical protein